MPRARRTSAEAAFVVLACLAGTVGVPGVGAAAAGCPNAVRDDIDGDGHADAVVADRGDERQSGAIHVLYGTAAGLAVSAEGPAHDDQRFTQGSPGVPGTSERGDRWGQTIAVADFDGDGCADVAVGSPEESDSAPDDEARALLDATPGLDQAVGRVTVLYGSPSGLSARGAQLVSQAPPELRLPGEGEFNIPPQPSKGRQEVFTPGVREEGDRFGSALTTGDFDGDGIVDLAVAAAGEALGPDRGLTGQLEDALFPVRLQQGAVSIVYGSRKGLGQGARVARTLSHEDRPISGTAAYNDRFSEAIAAGDFDMDGVDDLAVSAPGVSADPVSGLKGVVQVFPGQAAVGLGGVPPQTFNRGTRDVPGFPREEEFGYTLAAGNLDGRNGDDLAISTQLPGGAGSVVVLYSAGTNGLTGPKSQVWAASSAGVPGRASVNDRFGRALAIGRFGGPGAAEDLAIGAQNEGFGGRKLGTVTVLFGGPRGLTASSAMLLTSGWVGRAPDGDDFGSAVAALPIRRAGYDDLLVGAPNHGVKGRPTATGGALHEFPTGRSGPRPAAVRIWRLDTPGVAGASFRGARLGTAIG